MVYPGNSTSRELTTSHNAHYRSSIIEGTKESLERLQVDYVDVIFAHRPDPTGKC